MKFFISCSAVFFLLLEFSSPLLGQQQCPTGKPSKQIARQITENGFSFWYYSLVYDSGGGRWCHLRKTVNVGSPVKVEWDDVLGAVLGGRMRAGPTGMIQSVAWEEGQTEEINSVLRYGDWELSYSKEASVYRSISELKKSYPKVISGIDAAVTDKEGKNLRVAVTLISQGVEAGRIIRYALTNNKTPESQLLRIGDPSQIGNTKDLEVIWTGKTGSVFKPGTPLKPGDTEVVSYENATGNLTIQPASLKVFLNGSEIVNARVSAYVPE